VSPSLLGKRLYENAFPTPNKVDEPIKLPTIEVTPSKKIVLNIGKNLQMPLVMSKPENDEREYSDDEEGVEEEDSEQIIYSSNSYDSDAEIDKSNVSSLP